MVVEPLLGVFLFNCRGVCEVGRLLEAVIFDMDGLMIDTEETYREGWLLGAQALGVELPETFVKGAAGRSIDDNIQALNAILDDMSLVMAIRNVREKHFHQSLAEGNIPLKPYLPELIQLLKKNQIKTAVATSSYRKRAMGIFDYYQMDTWFDAVVTGDEVKMVKPNPELYLTALDMLGVENQQALVLEDTVTGASAANNADIPFIIVPDSSSDKPIVIPEDFKYMQAKLVNLENVAEWLINQQLIEKR